MIVLFSSIVFAQSSCEHDASAFHCVKYIKNYDADTITFQIPKVHQLLGEKIGVRVRGIDSPEIKGHLPCEKITARTAKGLVENKLRNAKRIDLTNIGRDKYFRILADIIVDGESLSFILLKNNLAYKYDGGKKEKIDWCNRLPANKK